MSKGKLKLTELRVRAGKFKFDAWGDTAASEQDLGLVEIALLAEPGKLLCAPTLLASIGLHAVGRWFERSGDRSIDALRKDLLALAHAHERIVAGPDVRFGVPTGDGKWVGETIAVDIPLHPRDVRALGVRSFLSDGMVY